MNRVQKNWNDFFKDKEWSIRLGWHYKGTNRKYRGERISFFRTVITTILKLILIFIIGVIFDLFTNLLDLSSYFIIIASAIVIIRGIYIIIKSIFKGQLWF